MIDFKERLVCGKCFGCIMLSVASPGLFITIAELERGENEKGAQKELGNVFFLKEIHIAAIVYETSDATSGRFLGNYFRPLFHDAGLLFSSF